MNGQLTLTAAAQLDPTRDYMQDSDVTTVGDAIAKIRREVRAEYEAAGEPLGGGDEAMWRWDDQREVGS